MTPGQALRAGVCLHGSPESSMQEWKGQRGREGEPDWGWGGTWGGGISSPAPPPQVHLLRPSRAPAFIRALPPPEPLSSRPAWGLRPLTNLPVLGSRSLPFPSCHSSALSTQFCESPHRPSPEPRALRAGRVPLARLCVSVLVCTFHGASTQGLWCLGVRAGRERVGRPRHRAGGWWPRPSSRFLPGQGSQEPHPAQKRDRPSAGTPVSPGNSPRGAPPDSGDGTVLQDRSALREIANCVWWV